MDESGPQAVAPILPVVAVGRLLVSHFDPVRPQLPDEEPVVGDETIEPPARQMDPGREHTGIGAEAGHELHHGRKHLAPPVRTAEGGDERPGLEDETAERPGMAMGGVEGCHPAQAGAERHHCARIDGSPLRRRRDELVHEVIGVPIVAAVLGGAVSGVAEHGRHRGKLAGGDEVVENMAEGGVFEVLGAVMHQQQWTGGVRIAC